MGAQIQSGLASTMRGFDFSGRVRFVEGAIFTGEAARSEIAVLEARRAEATETMRGRKSDERGATSEKLVRLRKRWRALARAVDRDEVGDREGERRKKKRAPGSTYCDGR